MKTKLNCLQSLGFTRVATLTRLPHNENDLDGMMITKY